MISKNKLKAKIEDIPQEVYDTRLGYTLAPYVRAENIVAQSGKNIPGGIGSPASIEFFKNLFEPQYKAEPVEGYRKRLAHLANLFCSLDHTMQEFVLASREDNIFWRGETMTDFGRVCDQMESHRICQ